MFLKFKMYSGGDVFINPVHVQAIYAANNENNEKRFSYVQLTHNRSLYCVEGTPEEVSELIEEYM